KIFGIVTLRGSWPEPCPGSPCPTLSRPPRSGGTRSGVRGIDGGVMIGRARTRVKPTFPIPWTDTGERYRREPDPTAEGPGLRRDPRGLLLLPGRLRPPARPVSGVPQVHAGRRRQ